MTGGAGFIGRRVVDRLEARGDSVLVVDRARGLDVLDEALPWRGLDAVVHLAGRLGTAELFDAAEEAIDANVRGTARVLEAARREELRYVGITMPAVWTNPYQITKRAARDLASAWHRAFGIPVAHVRAFNVYGAGQRTGPGHPRKIVPTFSVAGWAGEPIEVWGSGEQTVDLVDVDDVARMLVAALDFGDDETFDAGTGVAVSVAEVAEFVREATGGRAPIANLPMRLGEEEGTAIRSEGEGWELLGWRPEFSWSRLLETVASYRDVAAGAGVLEGARA
ncbi:MAG TPA: NAD(P)-dependent oxidoreductase [Actinomycetota bacterium]|nr:NAD(P)-dependent oxidoreductase [Actinomycetota bacterium]